MGADPRGRSDRRGPCHDPGRRARRCGGTSEWLAYTRSDDSQDYEAIEATCDGLDNDCDGDKDEWCGSGTCASPWFIPSSGGSNTNRMNGSSTTSGSCGGNGVDSVYRWVPSTSGAATISYSGNFWPASLWVRSGSCNRSEVACD